jgi:DNA-binding NtrC family response regulator
MAGARLLIVEDDDAIAELFVDALDEEGYHVERVPSPQQAIDLLAARGPAAFDVILSSPFTSPRQAPYLWLDRIRAATDAGIVICSGYPATQFGDHRARGYAAFLQEPFDLQTLVNLVASLTNGVGE